MVKQARLNLEGMRESTRLKVKAWLEYEPDFAMPYVEIPKDYETKQEEKDGENTK